MNTVTLITGGVRSGKSRYALELARSREPGRKCFLATAQPLDEEIKIRIARHQAERGREFFTAEEPLHLAAAAGRLEGEADLILIDCLTLWVNNLLYHFSAQPEKVRQEIESFIEVVHAKKVPMILVTNEIGLGVVPESPLSRRFIDELGRLNQEMARVSDEVILMVAGIPQVLRGSLLDAKLDRTF